MKTNHWSDQDRQELEALRKAAWDHSTKQAERNEKYVELLLDAVQAHRKWAREVLDTLCLSGGGSDLKNWRKRTAQVMVAHDGRLLSKPRVIGIRRTDAGGHAYSEQTLFDLFTWDEIDTKRKAYLKQIGAYDTNIALLDRLAQLRELAPGASTPAEACRRIGTTLDEWLGAEAA